MKYPTEMQLQMPDDRLVMVRFDYDTGEQEWFDARAGVGSPGYPPSVAITELDLGDGWVLPDAHPEINFEVLEEMVADKLHAIDLECAEGRERTEVEYPW